MPGKGDEDQGWPNLSKQGLHVQKISKTSTASEKKLIWKWQMDRKITKS